MKTKILAITLFVIGAFIACKKVGENVSNTAKYTDAELNIDKNSTFAVEERKIKVGILEFDNLTIKDRFFLVKNLRMENKHPKYIVNGMEVFNKLDINEQVKLITILLSTPNITVYSNNTNRYEYPYTNPTTEFKPKSCWITVKNSYQSYGCPDPGDDVCFRYIPENCN